MPPEGYKSPTESKLKLNPVLSQTQQYGKAGCEIRMAIQNAKKIGCSDLSILEALADENKAMVRRMIKEESK